MSTPNELLAASACYRCIPKGKQPGVLLGMISAWESTGLATGFTPKSISCLQAWYRSEELAGGIDAQPIAQWPPYVGAFPLIPYDPEPTGTDPLYETGTAAAAVVANLAPGGAFAYQNPPYPCEVYLVGFINPASQGTVQATVLDTNQVAPFTAYSLTAPPGIYYMNAGALSASNLHSSSYNLEWTTFDFCFAAANSYIGIAGTDGILAPANTGANTPGNPLVIGETYNFGVADMDQVKWGGSLVEVLIFSCVLTSTQRASLRAYFKKKYAILF